MYNQVPQQQVPYLQPVPAYPQQGDTIEQASKLIDLIERLGQRQGGAGNLAPGTSQFSPFNVGQFQSRNPQEIAAQELLLRNPELLRQYQQQTQQPQQLQQQQVAQGERIFSQQDVEKVKQSADQLIATINFLHNQLQKSWEVSKQLLNAYNASQAYAREVENVAQLGVAANTLSNAFNQELNACYEMIAVQDRMLTTPLYLLSHSFGLFNNEIQPNDKQAIELISSFYLELVRNFNEKHKQSFGDYSPQYKGYLQQKIDEQVQQRVAAPQNQVADAAVMFARGLQSPDFGRNLQRQHTQRLVANGR